MVIGEVIGYDDFGKDKTLLLIKDLATGRELVSLNNAPPYWSEARERALLKLDWAEQWNVMTQYYEIDSEHQKSKETKEYLNRTGRLT